MKRFFAILVGISAIWGSLPPPAQAITASPVTLETLIDFSAPPFRGTFEVVEGAEVVGCANGTFVDTPAGGFGWPIDKRFTCGDGVSAFTIRFRACILEATEETCAGNWNVRAGSTGAAAGLRGQGDFNVLFLDTDPPSAIETMTGWVIST